MANFDKSPYSAEELDYFEQLLRDELEESRTQIEQLEAGLEGMQEQHDDTYSSFDHHQGNVASEEAEEEKNYRLLEQEKDKVKEVKDALARIEEETYGICQQTGNQIQKERLEAIPYARYSVDAQKENI